MDAGDPDRRWHRVPWADGYAVDDGPWLGDGDRAGLVRPALLGTRYAPQTPEQLAQYDAGAVAADQAWAGTGPWLTSDDMPGRDPYWVHGYWAHYYELLPALYARQATGGD